MTPLPLARRALLSGALAVTVPALAGCSTEASRAQPRPVRPTRHRYGRDPEQFGDLYRPAEGPSRGTVVVLHGGFWQSTYGLELGADPSADLAARGWTAWNVEYRRIRASGGWPNTFLDVAAAIDHLARLEGVRTDRVVTLGHSAGGQLAAWAATRGAAVPGGAPQVPVTGVVPQAGVLDLRTASGTGLGGMAVLDLVGGQPDRVPDRYRAVDPIERVPLGVPVRCVHGTGDTTVPLTQSSAFVAAARAAGDDAELVEVPGDHYALIDPTTAAWRRTVAVLEDLSR